MHRVSTKPANESERLAFLRSLELLDTPPESSFNRIAESVARMFEVPIATVSLVDDDRVWLKARHGVSFDEVERQCAFCARVVSRGRPLVVEDTMRDDRYSDWPLVRDHGARFFAGTPLRSPEGFDVGALCLLDTRTRSFSPEEMDRLSASADMLMEFILLRHSKRQSDASNRAKSTFLAHMSHELRTPMTAIIGYTDAISSGALDTETHREACSIVSRNARHLLRILDDVLDLSKIEAERLRIVPKATPTLALLAHARAPLTMKAAEKGLDLEFALEHGIPAEIQTDETRVRQVLFNLVSNAIKFTERGRVRVTASWRAQGSDGLMSVAVEDTGPGMEPEALERVFQPFEQGDTSIARRFGGAGLGLTISRRLAESLGGSLTATSTPGEGSRFVFEFATGSPEGIETLPHADPLDDRARHLTTQPARTEAESACKTLLGAHILVAEDSRDNQRLIKLVLERAGAEVTFRDDGQEAIDEISRAPERYALVLMDVQMPILDGLEATRRLRAHGHTIPVIALTAHAMVGDRESCLDAGCTDYLAKPFDRAELIRICSNHAERRGERAA